MSLTTKLRTFKDPVPFSNTILHEKEKQKSKCGIYNVSFVQKQLSILNNNSLNIYDGDFCDIS